MKKQTVCILWLMILALCLPSGVPVCAQGNASAADIPADAAVDFIVYPAQEGLIIAGRNEKYGFVDGGGSPVIACGYDNAYGFCGGLAAVQMNGRWGYIDAAGSAAIPCQYDYAYDFSEGLA